ncbi:hypothetical protein ACTWJ8_15585 [Streptomyces sp. SDT5-1]|uniref:hypothetical protein n=1 Tax=Streptomyces sp. SDT5-1 TaxID=3406418 RepID=UPI003FD3528E
MLGTPERPDLVQRITDAGAKFAEVPVVKATNVHFHNPSRGHDHYTSTTTVRLPPEPGAQPATTRVHPTTPDRPRAGGTIPVLYAPSNPALGAVPGTEQTLAATLNGSTLNTGRKLIVAITWTAGLALSVTGVSLRHGFRSFSRLRSTDMSVRVTCQGPGVWRHDTQKQLCLKVTTSSSRTAHFLTPITENHVPDSLVGQQLWLYWDTSTGSSALISDADWVMHGKLPRDDAQMLTPEATPATPDAPRRPLHLWNPTSAWPLYVKPSVLLLAVATIACAAVLTFDVTGIWRWATGAAGALTTLTVCYLTTTTPHSSRRNG